MNPDGAPMLPGLDLPAPAGPPAGRLVAAVTATLDALAEELRPVHAGKVALALELAAIIEHKRTEGRLSTVAMDARLLAELLDELAPESATTGVDDALAAAMAEWADVAG